MAALSHIDHMFEIQPHEKVGKLESEIQKMKEERKANALQYFAGKIFILRVLLSSVFSKAEIGFSFHSNRIYNSICTSAETEVGAARHKQKFSILL